MEEKILTFEFENLYKYSGKIPRINTQETIKRHVQEIVVKDYGDSPLAHCSFLPWVANIAPVSCTLCHTQWSQIKILLIRSPYPVNTCIWAQNNVEAVQMSIKQNDKSYQPHNGILNRGNRWTAIFSVWNSGYRLHDYICEFQNKTTSLWRQNKVWIMGRRGSDWVEKTWGPFCVFIWVMVCIKVWCVHAQSWLTLWPHGL